MVKASELQKYLGNQIKRYRKSANLSQEQLAEIIGIATNSLSSIETGNSFMTSSTMEKLINTLNISPKELFDFPEINIEDINMAEDIRENLKTIEKNKEKLTILYNFVRLLK